MTGRRGIELAEGRRVVTGCTLTAPGSPPDPDRDVALVGLLATTGVQFVHLHDPTAPEVHEAAADAGLLVTDLALPRPLRLGWERGDERDLPDRLRRRRPWGSRPTIVAGFGAPSVPAGASAQPHELGGAERHTPREAFADDATWARATRDYQAMIVRFHLEAVRRLDRPAAVVAGPLWHPATGASPSLVDADLRPKEAYRALSAGARRRMATADRLPPHLHGHEALALDVHVLNDDADALDASITATLRWADGEQRYRYRAGAGPGEARRVGTLQVVVPPVSGPLDLVVELDLGDRTVTSTYLSEIFADPHDH